VGNLTGRQLSCLKVAIRKVWVARMSQGKLKGIRRSK